MSRDLLTNDLNADNVADAEFTDKVDPVDQLRRIATAWKAIGLTCRCTRNQGCDICEIDYLIEEAFEVPQ